LFLTLTLTLTLILTLTLPLPLILDVILSEGGLPRALTSAGNPSRRTPWNFHQSRFLGISLQISILKFRNLKFLLASPIYSFTNCSFKILP
jgi:hypothetical protein